MVIGEPHSIYRVGSHRANGRFESDLMSNYLTKWQLSGEAMALMNEGKKIWQKYHATQFPRKIRDKFRLNRPDTGWYQIRKALEANEGEIVDFSDFKEAYDALSMKLRPKVYEVGFLK